MLISIAVSFASLSVPANANTASPDQFARVSGHVSAKGRQFHYTATFFRFASRVVVAGFELTDDTTSTYVCDQRIQRSDAHSGSSLASSIEDWSLQPHADDVSIEVGSGTAAVRLRIITKGAHAASLVDRTLVASLPTSGTIAIGGRRFAVAGVSAIERSDDPDLARRDASWTWLTMQMFDGSYVAVYLRRDANGSVVGRSGVVLSRTGGAVLLGNDDISLPPWGAFSWRSPVSGALYPMVWLVRVKTQSSTIDLEPTMRAQEVVPRIGGPSFWEGAVEVRRREDFELIGWGFVSMRGPQLP